MKKKLVYATENPGKLKEVKKLLKSFGINIVSPKDFKISLDVKESGSTLKENSKLKVEAYLDAINREDVVIVVDDTGLEIDALNGEPGIHVRKWKDKKTRMSDQQIFDYCLSRLEGVPEKRRGAQFRSVVAVGTLENKIEHFEGILKGVIMGREEAQLGTEGFPFEGLFWVPEWKMFLGEAHKLPLEEKFKLLTHRGRALKTALPKLRKLLK